MNAHRYMITGLDYQGQACTTKTKDRAIAAAALKQAQLHGAAAYYEHEYFDGREWHGASAIWRAANGRWYASLSW